MLVLGWQRRLYFYKKFCHFLEAGQPLSACDRSLQLLVFLRLVYLADDKFERLNARVMLERMDGCPWLATKVISIKKLCHFLEAGQPLSACDRSWQLLVFLYLVYPNILLQSYAVPYHQSAPLSPGLYDGGTIRISTVAGPCSFEPVRSST